MNNECFFLFFSSGMNHFSTASEIESKSVYFWDLVSILSGIESSIFVTAD